MFGYLSYLKLTKFLCSTLKMGSLSAKDKENQNLNVSVITNSNVFIPHQVYCLIQFYQLRSKHLWLSEIRPHMTM